MTKPSGPPTFTSTKKQAGDAKPDQGMSRASFGGPSAGLAQSLVVESSSKPMTAPKKQEDSAGFGGFRGNTGRATQEPTKTASKPTDDGGFKKGAAPAKK